MSSSKDGKPSTEPGDETVDRNPSTGVPVTEPESAEDAKVSEANEAETAHSADKPTDEAGTETTDEAPAETEPTAHAQADPPAARPASGSDGFARFVAVIAVLIAIAVLILTQFSSLPWGSAARVKQLETQIAERTTSAEGGSAAVEALAAEQAQALERLAALEARLEAEAGALASRVDELASDISALSGADAPSGSSEAVSALEQELALVRARLETLQSDVAGLADAPSAPGPAPTATVSENDGPDPRVESIASEIQVLRTELEGLKSAQSRLDSAMAEGDAAVQAEVNRALDQASQGLGARIDQLAARADEEKTRSDGELAGRAAVALAAARLRDAAAGGRSFAGAWTALEGLGIGGDSYPELGRLAATGAPTLAALKQGFATAASDAIVAEQMGAGDGWADGALRQIGSLVRVRRTGDLDGDTAEAIVARAEQRLTDGDLAAALQELDSLQEDAKTALSAWLTGARDRLALDSGIERLQGEVLAGLGGGSNQ